MRTSTPNPDDLRPATPETARVEDLLTRTGGAYRQATAGRRLSPEAAERIRRAVLAEARPGGQARRTSARSVADWLRALARPLAYATLGAAAALACVVWLQANRGPAGQLLYTADRIPSASIDEPAPLAPGQTLIARNDPGAVLQVGDNAWILLRPDTAVEVVSSKIVALKTGEIWVHYSGDPGDLIVMTPQGKITPNKTVFGVRAGQLFTGEFQVAVMEGSVEVARSNRTQLVGEGDRLEWPLARPEPEVAAGAARAPAWTQPILLACRDAAPATLLPISLPQS